MITGDHVAIVVGLVAGFTAYAAFGMARWRTGPFWAVCAVVTAAGLLSSRLCAALLPAATGRETHWAFLLISSSGTALLGSRIGPRIEAFFRR